MSIGLGKMSSSKNNRSNCLIKTALIALKNNLEISEIRHLKGSKEFNLVLITNRFRRCYQFLNGYYFRGN